MKKLITVFLFAFIVPFSDCYSQSQQIEHLCNQINKDSLKANVQALEAFGSRYAFNDNRKQVAEYLRDRLNDYGFEAELDSFYLEMEYPYFSGIHNEGWQYNVVGRRQGTWVQDTSVHLGAHYDAVSFKEGFDNFVNIAPGADDNASGVAALLEIARVFVSNEIEPIKTLVINFYAAEEQGLIGSNHTINNIAFPTWSENIVAMINLDMVGYTEADSNHFIGDIISYYNSQDLTDMAIEYANLYTTLTPFETTENNNASDSYSYYSYGVRSVFLCEHDFTPHYHTERDVFSTLNFDYMLQQTRLATALTYECSVNNDYGTVSFEDSPNSKQQELTIYGQPCKGEIRFSLTNSNGNYMASLYDLEGRKVCQMLVSDHQNLSKMEIMGLKSGIYVLKLECGNQIFSKKVIVLQ